MKLITQFEFRSGKFPPYEGEEEQINPGLWGKRLAEYLKEKLSAAGITTNEIIAEDWGYWVPVRNEAFELAIGCGHQNGDADEFLCFIEPDRPVIRKWFRKIDTTQDVGRLSMALEKIFRADSDIRELNCRASDER